MQVGKRPDRECGEERQHPVEPEALFPRPELGEVSHPRAEAGDLLEGVKQCVRSQCQLLIGPSAVQDEWQAWSE
jgi:hypothetical protein